MVTGTEEKRLLPLVVVGCTVITAFRRCRRSRETRRTYSQVVLAEVPGEREGFPVDNGGMGVREDVRYSGGTPVVRDRRGLYRVFHTDALQILAGGNTPSERSFLAT